MGAPHQHARSAALIPTGAIRRWPAGAWFDPFGHKSPHLDADNERRTPVRLAHSNGSRHTVHARTASGRVLREDLVAHVDPPGAEAGDLRKRGRGEVEAATVYVWTPVVDPDHDRLAGGLVGDRGPGVERQVPVRRGQPVGVERLAAGGPLSPPRRTRPCSCPWRDRLGGRPGAGCFGPRWRVSVHAGAPGVVPAGPVDLGVAVGRRQVGRVEADGQSRQLDRPGQLIAAPAPPTSRPATVNAAAAGRSWAWLRRDRFLFTQAP